MNDENDDLDLLIVTRGELMAWFPSCHPIFESEKFVPVKERVCVDCKHYGITPYKQLRCENPEVIDMLKLDEYWDDRVCIEPPTDFGCLRWEAKV